MSAFCKRSKHTKTYVRLMIILLTGLSFHFSRLDNLHFTLSAIISKRPIAIKVPFTCSPYLSHHVPVV